MMLRAMLLSLCLLAGPLAATEVSISFIGDIMLDDGPGKTIADGGDPLAGFDALLRRSDFSIGNLECPVAAGGSALERKIITFRADPAVMRVLRGRFHALSVANNHSGDYGREAFLETLAHLNEAGIRAVGGGRNLTEAHAPLWLEKNGLRIALLAYNEFKPRRFEAGADWPGIAWSTDSEVIADIRAARKAGADVIIPFMHWGWEREPKPDARQWQLARRMIDAGADAVVGNHPHVTQGAGIYRGKPILWSLGNFVFDGFELPAAKIGWMLRMTLDKSGVVSWHTLGARIDEAGTPTPDGTTSSPCGKRGDTAPRQCQGMPSHRD